MEEQDKKQVEQSFGLDPKDDYSEYDEIKARIVARKMEQQRKKKRNKTIRRVVMILILILIGLLVFSFSSFFDVDSIEVEGNSYFTADEIINMGHAEPGKNLIYHPDKKNIVNYLEANPYIREAKVSRRFPSTLVITVDERTQIGAIQYSDQYIIIDEEGIVLRKTKTTPMLTEIKGIVVSRIKLGERIGVKDVELLDQTIDIIKTMREKDLYYVKLDMSNMYILAYIYDSLICKGTYKQIMEGMTSDKLHKVLVQLFGDNIKRGTITFSDEGYVSFVPTI